MSAVTGPSTADATALASATVSITTPTPSSKHIVVVGGAFAGTAFIKTLQPLAAKLSPPPRITLIDARDGFFHNVAGPRAIVEAGVAAAATMPFARIFEHVEVVHARVVEAHSTHVVTDNGASIAFDYLVVATGSDYAAPSKFSAEATMAGIVDSAEHLRQAVVAANRVLIVGGGAVGIEIAAEIRTDFPAKTVTLVHSRPRLFDTDAYKPVVGVKLRQGLEKLAVNLVLGDRVEVSAEERAAGYTVETRALTTAAGKTIESDVQIFAIGNARYNTQLLATLGEGVIDPDTGFVLTRPTLQLAKDGLQHIYAVGDINNQDSNKLAFVAAGMGKLAGQNLAASLSGAPDLKLKNWKAMNGVIAVSLGRNGGAGQLPFGVVIGNWAMRMLKSKDMGVAKFSKNMARKA